MKRPNILIITCHDLGDYLGCYGTPVATPNLDSMAEQGVLFENHFATASICCPSRGSLVTGCYPHTHGLMGLVPRGWELNVDHCPALPELLHDVGYQTHLFGLQHEHWDPRRLGYSHVHPVESTHSEDVSPVFADWLSEIEENGQPFLANVGFFEPHRIGLASQGYNEALFGTVPSHFKRDVYESTDPAQVEIRPYLPDIPELRQEVADFYGAVAFMDYHAGKVLQALDDAGLTESTLVIFATDHGASFMHSKGTLYDGGVKAACLMRWPGILPAGHRVKALTNHVDLLPSLFDLLELPMPDHIQGRSFAAIAQNNFSDTQKYVFAEKNYTQYYDPARMVRSNSFKYIRKGLNTCLFDFVITEIELSPASFRSNQKAFDFYSARRYTEELYDLTVDPAEMNNLVDNPAYRTTLNEMQAALDVHLKATNDPFRYLRNDLLMPTDVYVDVRS
ncbi:MAG: sulfatase [Bacteroidetes bacterium]|nr:sulfatase [Bacteroidota bacterium]